MNYHIVSIIFCIAFTLCFYHSQDVEELYKNLGNPFGKFRVPHEQWNHLDFMWAKDVKELLYDKIISLMTHFQQ